MSRERAHKRNVGLCPEALTIEAVLYDVVDRSSSSRYPIFPMHRDEVPLSRSVTEEQMFSLRDGPCYLVKRRKQDGMLDVFREVTITQTAADTNKSRF